MRRIVLFGAWVLLGGACSWAQNATLAGTILDDAGKGVAGAIVTVHRSSIDGPLRASESHLLQSKADGSFSLPGLFPGPFVVCASVPSRPLLDPCRWTDPPVVIRVAANGTTHAQVSLVRGAIVNIRLDDPLLALPAPPGAAGALPAVAVAPPSTNASGAAPVLVIGVRTAKGNLNRAWISSSDAAGQNHTIVVPAGIDVPLSIRTRRLGIADTAGTALDQTKPLTIHAQPGATVQLRYVVHSSP